MVKRRARPIALAGAAVGLSLAACQIVAGIERVEKVPPEVDAAPDVAEAALPPDPCAHARPPGPPDVDDAPAETDQLDPVLFAVRSLAIVPPKNAEALGFDLDGVCTCDRRPFTAYDGGSSCALRTPLSSTGRDSRCDGDGGVDNQAAALFGTYDGVLDVSREANDPITSGYRTILVQINDWNGRANDRKVTVGFFVSDGLNERPETTGACATAFTSEPDAGRPEAGYWAPTWCGDDRWSVEKESVLGSKSDPPLVPVRTASGYVRDHWLVVSSSNDALQVPLGQAVLGMFDATVVARIVPLDPKTLEPAPDRPPSGKSDRFFALTDGMFAGRVPARDLLVTAGMFGVPKTSGSSRKHVCSEALLFDQIKGVICAHLDIAREPDRDHEPSRFCDAISAAIGFEAAPARTGAFYTLPLSENECRLGQDDQPVDAGREVVYACPDPAADAGP